MTDFLDVGTFIFYRDIMWTIFYGKAMRIKKKYHQVQTTRIVSRGAQADETQSSSAVLLL